MDQDVGYDLIGMHGYMTSYDREANIKRWIADENGILLTTDIILRGIYFDCKWIINYDLPTSKENYIYRVGRKEKMPRKRVILNFVYNESLPQLREIETFYDTNIDPLPMEFLDICN